MEETKIPEMSISDNKIVKDRKSIPIIIDGAETNIIMEKLSAGQKKDLVKAHTSTKMVGTQVQGNMDAVGYQIGLMSKVIVEAPFETTEAALNDLPAEVLEYLFSEYQAWTENKKKD